MELDKSSSSITIFTLSPQKSKRPRARYRQIGAGWHIELDKLVSSSVAQKTKLIPKLRLPGCQCDWKFSPGDQNFVAGRQLATCKAGCHLWLLCSEKLIKNWNLEAICQQVSYFLSCWYIYIFFFHLWLKAFIWSMEIRASGVCVSLA